MSEASKREHALSGFFTAYRAPPVAMPGVSIEVVPDLFYFNLRGRSDDLSFRHACREALGQELPVHANTVTRGPHRVYWLGPTEWLLIAEPQFPQMGQHLAKALQGTHAAVTDLSGGQLMLRLSGKHVRDLLAKGATLDLHERSFGVNSCAQSVMAKAAALFAQVDDNPTFELVVRRSFADYLAQWLDRAGREYDAIFVQ